MRTKKRKIVSVRYYIPMKDYSLEKAFEEIKRHIRNNELRWDGKAEIKSIIVYYTIYKKEKK